jgi:hypothetical protein
MSRSDPARHRPAIPAATPSGFSITGAVSTKTLTPMSPSPRRAP